MVDMGIMDIHVNELVYESYKRSRTSVLLFARKSETEKNP